MQFLVFAVLVAAIAAPAAAEGPFGLPVGYSWGDAPDPAAVAAVAERQGAEIRILLDLETAPLSDARSFTAVYCDGHGLQQIRTATTRYHRGDVLRRFRRLLAILENEFGPPSHGRPEVGTAYWEQDVGLETWPVSKTKFMVVLIRNGPGVGHCAAEDSV